MTCQFRASEIGPTSTPSLPRRWQDVQSFLKTASPGGSFALDAQSRAIRVDDGLPGLGLMSEDGLRPGLNRSTAATSSCCRRAGSISAGGTQPSSREESNEAVQPVRLRSTSRMAPPDLRRVPLPIAN